MLQTLFCYFNALKTHGVLFGDSTEIQTTIFHLISLVLLKYMKESSAFWISVPIVAFSDPA